MVYSLVCNNRFQLLLTLSIQYVYELNFLFPKLVSSFSGCKYKTLFFYPQYFLNIFLEKISQPSPIHT